VFSSQYFRFHLSEPFQHCSIPIFTNHPHCIIFSSQYSSFPCQYHSTIPPYTFIHLPPKLYNFFLPVLQFPPVRTIPPLLHTHSFTYHPHSIMFSSQYFSFPLSVAFHHCSIPIFTYHSHFIMFSSQYFRFPLSVPFHHCSIPIFTYHTHYIMFLSLYFSFPLSESFHHCSIPTSLTTHTIQCFPTST